jgi:hypothetical protein
LTDSTNSVYTSEEKEHPAAIHLTKY